MLFRSVCSVALPSSPPPSAKALRRWPGTGCTSPRLRGRRAESDSDDGGVPAGRRILPKAEDEATARKCLELLSGRRHRVLSAIALRAPDGAIRERLSETVVMFKRLSSAEIDAYLASGEWEGKAGGYAIQGIAEGLISRIQGSHSGVVGLPLYETRTLLRAAGFDIA